MNFTMHLHLPDKKTEIFALLLFYYNINGVFAMGLDTFIIAVCISQNKQKK